MKKIKTLLITMFLTALLAACDINPKEVLNSDVRDKITEEPKNIESTPLPAKPTTPPLVTSEPSVTSVPSVTAEPSVTIAPAKETEANNSMPEIAIMSPPPFEYYLSADAETKEVDPLTLKLKSSEPNEITDDDKWFQENDLTLAVFDTPYYELNLTDNLPDQVDAYWSDLYITKAFYDNSYLYCSYGSDFSEGYILNIYDAVSSQLLYNLDFSNYRYSPTYIEDDYDYIQQRIQWATIKDDILYISHSHSTYAESSGYMNAYITAVDLSNMSILWRSEALKSNSYNFILMDDVIICGYGFTAEADYLYQINRYTGDVIDQVSVKSAPSYIILKDNTLYVRTYNTDYEFEITD